jgi:hypothetical protein
MMRGVRQRVGTVAAALVAASLWLVANIESVRAPWGGIILVASGVAFIATGHFGRGWRALLSAGAAAAVAVLLVDPLIWHSEPVEPGTEQSCDPGCLPIEAAVAFAIAAATLLASLGILLRRGLAIAGRARSARR